MGTEEICEHIASIDELKQPNQLVCEECIKTGDTWVHLRTCQTCGITLCCNSSRNKHMTAHYHATQHPVVISAQPHEKWLYCYKDDVMAEY